ncbi:MAG: hypothetical protein HY422_02645 [Candidatus Komeilibacteria bacterium]|nr:hypothetical protein [Candidatus Komeilibacteria bacterium]
MNKIEKLFRKISAQDRERLLMLIQKLAAGELRGLDIVKIKNTNFFRVRSGTFRLIFHREKNGDVIVDSIRMRNEKTYQM